MTDIQLSRLPPIEIVPDNELRRSRATSLNRLCNLRDWEAWRGLSTIMMELRDCVTIHRKSWEYAICIDGLKQLGAVHPEARAIAVGAGYERPLFYFANLIRLMVATDLYDNPQHEGRPDMLTNPEHYAPFPFRRECLEVLQMSGTELRYPDGHFDFAFCLSSIEHFGSRANIRKALDEIIRVLKPGGKVCIVTELILNGERHNECFLPSEIEETFLTHPRARLVGGDFDLRIQKSLMDYPIDLDDPAGGDYVNVSPHIVLRSGAVVFTSLSMFLEKQ